MTVSRQTVRPAIYPEHNLRVSFRFVPLRGEIRPVSHRNGWRYSEGRPPHGPTFRVLGTSVVVPRLACYPTPMAAPFPKLPYGEGSSLAIHFRRNPP